MSDRESTNEADFQSSVEAMLAQVVAVLKTPLSDQELADVRRNVELAVQRAQIIEQFPIENRDVPAFVFQPFRAKS